MALIVGLQQIDLRKCKLLLQSWQMYCYVQNFQLFGLQVIGNHFKMAKMARTIMLEAISCNRIAGKSTDPYMLWLREFPE